MKNCSGCPIKLRASIMNISKHYQVLWQRWTWKIFRYIFFLQNEHTNCHCDSPCRHPAYRPSKVLLTDPHVRWGLWESLTGHYDLSSRRVLLLGTHCIICITCISIQMFKCRDTFWVESFNHQLLTFIPKRVHFHSDTFYMRMSFAVLDWVWACLLYVAIIGILVFGNFAEWEC